MYDHNENFSKDVLNYFKMLKWASRNAHVLYVTLLTKVIEYFDIPRKNEKCIEYDDVVLGKDKLESLKYKSMRMSNQARVTCTNCNTPIP